MAKDPTCIQHRLILAAVWSILQGLRRLRNPSAKVSMKWVVCGHPRRFRTCTRTASQSLAQTFSLVAKGDDHKKHRTDVKTATTLYITAPRKPMSETPQSFPSDEHLSTKKERKRRGKQEISERTGQTTPLANPWGVTYKWDRSTVYFDFKQSPAGAPQVSQHAPFPPSTSQRPPESHATHRATPQHYSA